jgi:hypothetical protein
MRTTQAVRLATVLTRLSHHTKALRPRSQPGDTLFRLMNLAIHPYVVGGDLSASFLPFSQPSDHGGHDAHYCAAGTSVLFSLGTIHVGR